MRPSLQVKGILSPQTKNKSSQTNRVGELKLKVPYTPSLISAAVRTENVKGHLNPDMNGKYLNVSARLHAGGNMRDLLGSIQTGLSKAFKTGGQCLHRLCQRT